MYLHDLIYPVDLNNPLVDTLVVVRVLLNAGGTTLADSGTSPVNATALVVVLSNGSRRRAGGRYLSEGLGRGGGGGRGSDSGEGSRGDSGGGDNGNNSGGSLSGSGDSRAGRLKHGAGDLDVAAWGAGDLDGGSGGGGSLGGGLGG